MTNPSNEALARLAAAQRAADGIMALEGFEASAGMQALDGAMLAGRASLDDVLAFLKLHAAITGADSVLAAIGEGDPRFHVIAVRRAEQHAMLRDMAIGMDGTVRVAFDL